MPAMFCLLMLQAHYTISAERQRQEIITLTGCFVQQKGLVLQVSVYLPAMLQVSITCNTMTTHLLQFFDKHAHNQTDDL